MNARLTPDLERTLRSYVLGGLDEAVRPELEELLITDPDAFEALGVVEDELLEEYLDGGGTEADRLAFERHFLTSPQRAARLRFASALRARASLGMAAEPPRPQRPTVRPVRWQPAWIGLAAALAASLAGNLWLASRDLSPTQAVSPRSPTPAMAPIGDSERSRAEVRATAPDETSRRSHVGIVTFALSAGALRAGGVTRRVTVPAGAVVRLRLELAGDDYALYRAALLDAEGDEVWAASKLKAEAEAGRAAVVLVLPAGLLPRGDYQLKLSGLAERGALEAVGSYAFRVSAP